ncbi:MAG: aldo/keto reductase [Prochlorothrix sp.]|nr:aldo/keto reductase [Prochlorothrix sp.]
MNPIDSPQTFSLATASGDPLIVPALGIGTWAWGDSLYWTYGKDYGETDVHQAFTAALDAGITLFDTAEVYGLGESERLLGKFTQARDRTPNSTAPRPSVQIASKYFPWPWRIFPQAVSEALTHSLDRLQIPSLPLYQVHWPFEFLIRQPALMEVLAQEVQRGRIQAVGVSNYSAAQLRQAHKLLAAHGVPLASNQVQYSLLERSIERNGTLDVARELGVLILAYCPLAQGLLTGKYHPHITPASATTPTATTAQATPQALGARSLNPRFKGAGLAKIEPLIQALHTLATEYDRTPAQVALNWLIGQGALPIPGAKTAQQATQNAGALGWQLTSTEQDHLAQLTV